MPAMEFFLNKVTGLLRKILLKRTPAQVFSYYLRNFQIITDGNL